MNRSRRGERWQFEVCAGLPAHTRWPRLGLASLTLAATAASSGLWWAFLPAAMLAGAARSGRRVLAVRSHTEPACWQARLATGWQAVRLRGVRSQSGYMALAFDLPAPDCVTNSTISCTVWAENMAADQWRRLRVVAQVAGCKAAYCKGAS